MQKRTFETLTLTIIRSFGLAAVLCCTIAGFAKADTLFWEDFDGYTYFPAPGGANNGIPEISEGADEYWYAGRFEAYEGGTIDSDLSIHYSGGPGNTTPVARMADEAGLLFPVAAGYENLTVSFDWRTYLDEQGDRLVVGYFVGDLGFDQGANRFRDFYGDDFGGNHNAAVNWWDTQWVEVLRDRSGSWENFQFALPDDTDLWVALWLDNGNMDFGKIDNIHLEGDLILNGNGQPVPEPATLLLVLAFGLVGICARCWRSRRAR